MVMHRSALLTCLSALALSGFAAGCGEFEVPSIVLDLRVLAMNVEPPEVVVPIDFDQPPELEEFDVPDIEACALVADPGNARSLEFILGACAPTDTSRCDDPARPYAAMAEGVVEDPEDAAAPVAICGALTPGADIYAVLEDSFANDRYSGFGGLPVQIELIVFAEGGSVQGGEYAAKTLNIAPMLPEERVANQNPSLDALMIETESGEQVAAPLGRCRDVEPYPISAGQNIKFVPQESATAREDYLLPTFDGAVRSFTENLTYTWYATRGDWQRGVSGGPKDIAGNDPPLDSEWRSPAAGALPAPVTDVSIWVVQRDERGGLRWYESCVRVTGS
jgi:hypothetical protein